MTKTIKKYSNPGKWEKTITLENVGEDREWLGIIDAREPGRYELSVVAEHRAPQTKGRIIVKAVVAKGANVAVAGMIKICNKAQETDSFLELRVLMLDKTAKASVDPKLEIEANNVKAGHAATVGEIDSEQVLYLMSRGLDENQARQEIIKGWLGV